MSQLLKTLNEQRGAKLKQAQTITEKVTAENRGFTDEERAEVRGLNDEIEKLNADMTQETRTIANLSAQGPKLSDNEERDLAKFDFGKVVRHLDRCHKGQPSQLDGIEAEMIQEGETEARSAGLNISGIALPTLIVAPRQSRAAAIAAMERRATLAAGTANLGGDLIETNKSGVFGDFYNSSVLEQSGALVLTGLVGNLDLPRYNSGTAPAAKAENAAAGDSAGTFTTLGLSPNRLTGYVEISDQLLNQTSENLTAFIGRQISAHMAGQKEVAFFHGSGTNEPTGIAGTAGIGSVVGGTNGAAPDWADIVDLETAIAEDNALAGMPCYFTNAAVRGKLKKTVIASGTSADMIWDRRTPEAPLNGYGAKVTNAVSSGLDKGTSSGVCSAIFFGNASDFVVGYWGGISLEVTRDSTDAKAGKRTLVANTYYDSGLIRAESFAAMLDALTA